MRISRLEIASFRNLSQVGLELAPGINTFFGPNGAGKTALLEAVHVLCRGRSFRTQQSRSLIQHGSHRLVVRAVIDDELRGPTTLAISKDRQSRTELRLNGQPERRLSEIARLTPIQVMLPDIAQLVFGGPGLRRSWLDWGTFHVKPDYLERLRRYLRAVKQRNALIREGATEAMLRPWNEELAGLGERVTADRREYLEALQPHVVSVLAQLAPDLELEMAYLQGWSRDESLHKLLGDSTPRELKYGTTQWGPHRADVQLRSGGSPAAMILSRGQGKMVASTLQIAQASLLADRARRASVFLIDDAGAELDAVHNQRFFEVLETIGSQVLATTTRDPMLEPRALEVASAVFHVEHGVVSRVNARSSK